MKNKVKIIAEIGVNHNGSLSLAKKLIYHAANSGADYAKFQLFQASKLVSEGTIKADYQSKNTKSLREDQLQMLKRYELSEKDIKILISECKKNDIGFLASAFDERSINFVCNQEVDYLKIPSGELSNIPYIKIIGKTGKKIILSTGMSDLEEVKSTVNLLFECGIKQGDLCILHCTSNYPAKLKEINLNAMVTMKKEFNVPVGYSDHSIGWHVSAMAVAMGATFLEKHITLDNDMDGPDHLASANIKDFKKYVKKIRETELILGSGSKIPTKSELRIKELVTKKIVAKTQIKKGATLSSVNLCTMRAQKGILAKEWESLIGKKAKKDYEIGDLIEI
jgi:N,N'-diacetyllegionaminate synthase